MDRDRLITHNSLVTTVRHEAGSIHLETLQETLH